MQQAEYFINSNKVAHNTSHKTREALTMAIANMHRCLGYPYSLLTSSDFMLVCRLNFRTLCLFIVRDLI